MLEQMLLPNELSLREAGVSDQDFVEEMFCSTRQHFYLMPLAKVQVDLLLKQQLVMQQTSYLSQFPTAKTYIVIKHAEPIGKIMVSKIENNFHVIDFVINQDLRGQGIGSSILRALQITAGQQGCSISLSVDQQNTRAKNLYLSLDFIAVGLGDTHEKMLWGK